MQTKTRMNVYFEPALLKRVEALALRRNVSKSAVIEAAVASFLSEDSAERLEAFSRGAWTGSAARSTVWTRISPSSAKQSPCSSASG